MPAREVTFGPRQPCVPALWQEGPALRGSRATTSYRGGPRMHPILRNERLSPNVTRLVLEAPRIAEIRQPGQFVIVHLGRGAERIPLTIADGDAEAGTISLVIQAIGKSTTDLVELQPGDAIADVAGPLGRPTDLPDHGHAEIGRASCRERV